MEWANPGHAGSRIKLDASYSSPAIGVSVTSAHRRLASRTCSRAVCSGEVPHGSCEYYERKVDRREGPKAPRHYQFVARGIAEALQAVGSGATYMQTSRVARNRAKRFPNVRDAATA